MELFAEVGHEFGAGGDRVTVKQVRHLLAASLYLSLEKGAFPRTLESPGSLLVHFGSRRDPIDRQKHILLGLHQMDYFVDGLHDGRPELLHVLKPADALVPLRVISMHTIMNDSIQIQVQVIYHNSQKLVNVVFWFINTILWRV